MTLILYLLLVSTCVSLRLFHGPDIEGDRERFRELLRDWYNRNRDQDGDRKSRVESRHDYMGNQIEGLFEIKHKREDKEHSHPHKQKHKHTIQMPGVVPSQMDTYLCVGYKLPTEESYIVKYEPAAKMQIAHHMLLYGCETPFKTDGYWNCREMQPVCGEGKQSIVYAWAKNAPSLEMPENVGFHVGGNTSYNYLVLQVHYLHVDMFKDGRTDKSGVSFWLDNEKKRYLAGIYLLADGYAPIPPHLAKSHIDMGCYYPEGPSFTAFRFRVHAHKLGLVVTGYRVRDNKWTLIGRGDPQRPQAFYEVFRENDEKDDDTSEFSKSSKGIDVKPGDYLMGRCTYNSTSRNTTTHIGATHADEMCNFYIMYFYDSKQYPAQEEVTSCAYPGARYFHSFPMSSDVPLAEIETRHIVDHSEEPLVL